MCFGGGGDGGAAAARAEEEKRQAGIASARAGVDTTFGATFTPEYYEGARLSYMDNYMPQLDKQFSDTKRKTTLSLARNNLSASTSAGRAYGDLQGVYDIALEKIKNDAFSYSSGLKGQVSGAKSDLYALAGTGVDAASMANLANERSIALSAPGQFDALGDFFSSIALQNQNRNQAARAGYIPRSPSLIFNRNSSNAVRTIS